MSREVQVMLLSRVLVTSENGTETGGLALADASTKLQGRIRRLPHVP